MSTNKLAIAMCDECEKMDNDYYEELIWDGVQFKCRRGHTEDIPQMLRNFKRAPELYDDLQAIIDHLRIIEARKKQLEALHDNIEAWFLTNKVLSIQEYDYMKDDAL